MEKHSGENIVTDPIRPEVQEAVLPSEGKINLLNVTPEVPSRYHLLQMLILEREIQKELGAMKTF